MKLHGFLEISRMFDFVWNRISLPGFPCGIHRVMGITATLPPLISHNVHCLLHSLGACKYCALSQRGYLNDLLPQMEPTISNYKWYYDCISESCSWCAVTIALQQLWLKWDRDYAFLSLKSSKGKWASIETRNIQIIKGRIRSAGLHPPHRHMVYNSYLSSTSIERLRLQEQHGRKTIFILWANWVSLL